MKEIHFLHKNIKRWKTFEAVLDGKKEVNPDEISDLYIQLTDDLSFAQTNFPDTKTLAFLNQLTGRIHGKIYKNKPIKRSRIFDFWLNEYPLIIYKSRKAIFFSFIIFFVSFWLGALSTKYDSGFARLVMGESYINMTEANIKKGDPMAVYKGMNETTMFLGITLNNIRVSFVAFVFGIFLSIGTGYVLFNNGVMLGAFQCFMVQNDVLWESLSTIWIHGTLEIFAIIVAGAGGLILGNSIIFPGTYSRLVSFKKGAMKGIKLVFGLIPIFILAGFLEGFVTRHTESPLIIRWGIIFMSLLLIIFYFFVYPRIVNKKLNNNER